MQTPSHQPDPDLLAPDFRLPATDGSTVARDTVRGPHGLLVMFLCNHCPYVQAVIDRLNDDCRELQSRGIGCVAIMSNDTVHYPADAFPHMQEFAEQHRLCFPYLYDESQAVARAAGVPALRRHGASQRADVRRRAVVVPTVRPAGRGAGAIPVRGPPAGRARDWRRHRRAVGAPLHGASATGPWGAAGAHQPARMAGALGAGRRPAGWRGCCVGRDRTADRRCMNRGLHARVTCDLLDLPQDRAFWRGFGTAVHVDAASSPLRAVDSARRRV
ncbi:MAG: redoxin domain-containing protein [Rhodoferax sp.]|nr:redoxin domain-containing protein [Rhodoferax sp.]